MDHEVSCGRCGKHYLVKAKFAGRKVKCRHCGNGMLVQVKGPHRKAEPSDADTEVAFSWEQPADWAPPPLAVVCVACGKVYQAPQELAGKTVYCRNCGTSVHVPHEESATVTMEFAVSGDTVEISS
jgi:DNA-directed RNA polymerase subunit RPC12/RpoP